MKIADYFVGNTRPIQYCRNHFKIVRTGETHIHVTPFRLSDSYPDGASPDEQHAAIIKEFSNYGVQILNGNQMLVSSLQAIENAIETGMWNFSSPLMQELLPTPDPSIQISYVKDRLYCLYLLFLCYRVLVWGEQRIAEPHKSQIYSSTMEGHETLRNACWEYVHFANTMYHDTVIKSQIVFDEPHIKEILFTNDLYDALMHQLLLHIATGEDGLNGQYLAECQICHHQFPKEHGSQKYCKECGRKSSTLRSRISKQRKKQKEAVNAQEKHP